MFYVSKADKLKQKLLNGTISARGLRALLTLYGWMIDRQKGSHETWTNGSTIVTLANHDKDAKPYQIKAVKKALFGDTDEENKE
jgi:predicted RNA binding protein YcfA (HicA-like mRNA interferase family)